ncbi:S8 family peptidase [Salmonirosea aquatica]|uniref:S8 family serine peptidase n=1 Tax=Salmonirosea aquatica TaxID=2654236 RepID=A0A7C9BI18_9BACT|nr:S8 family serine peptidase [Cytophagaceae bacterium SJW1-29]
MKKAFTPYRKNCRYTLLLALVLIVRISPSVWAQAILKTDQNRLDPTTAALTDFYLRQYQNTLQKARLQKWPLRIELGSGRSLALQRTDALGQPVYYTTHTTPLATGTHTAALYDGGGLSLKLSGSSPEMKGKMALWDGGNVRADHRELSGRIKQADAQAGAIANDHATHMAGILIAQGIYPLAKGMAFGAELLAWNFDNDLSEIVQQAPNLLISNHAYGPVAGWLLDTSRPGNSNDEKWEWWGTPAISETQDYRFGFYDEAVSEVDRITANFPYFLMVRSADNKRIENGPPLGTKYYLKNTDVQSTLPRSRNDGYDIIPGEANAKNVLTVGAADLQGQTFRMTPYSGWGPTDDGRIKPDLLGVGTQVLSSVGTDTDAYGVLTGTSMASANVSGSLLLLQELYRQRTNTFMLSSTLKGLALHTAGKPEGKTDPSYEYGWGLLNTEKAARVILNDEGKHLLTEQVLQQGGIFTQKFVALGSEPLVVTICWTDPEALPTIPSSTTVNSTTPKLVNDLDASMAEGFNSYQPWVLDPAAPAQPARKGNNFRDNVEQIYIGNPLKGRTYTLTVSHKNILKNGRQPFALIASGLEKPDCGQTAAITPGTDTTLCPGQTLTLWANAGNSYIYEWLLDGNVIKKGTDRSLEVNRPGAYEVRASTAGCTATSKTVKVQSSDVFADITQKGEILVCDSRGMELSANTGPGYTYQWLRDGTPVAGATNPRHQATESGMYQVRIGQRGCAVVSAATRVEVTPVKADLDPAVSAIICNGKAALLKAPQEKAYTYSWFYNNTLLSGATSATLQAVKPGRYAVEVRNGGCRVRSTDVVVQQVNVAADIIPPATTQIPPGASVVLKANYELGNYYEWYRNAVLMTHETAPLLTVTQGGAYQVAIQNQGCRAESATVLLWGGTPDTTPIITGLVPSVDSSRMVILYPNPTHEMLTVAVHQLGYGQVSSAAVLTIQGQAIVSQPLLPEGGYLKTDFNVRTLPLGNYLIKITVGEQVFTEHFVKH